MVSEPAQNDIDSYFGEIDDDDGHPEDAEDLDGKLSSGRLGPAHPPELPRPSRSVSETALLIEEKIPRPRAKLGFVVIEPASLAPMVLQASLSASELRESSLPSSSDFFCWINSRNISAVELTCGSSWLALRLLPLPAGSLSSSQELLHSSPPMETGWLPGTLTRIMMRRRDREHL